jgi:Flp pilus assembly protein TadG
MKHSPADIRDRLTSVQQDGRGATVRGFLSTLARSWTASTRGIAAVEFALVLPVLVLVFFAIIKFGIVFNNYIVLENGVENGARQAATQRAAPAPLSTTIAAVNAGASSLTAANITVSMYVNGTKCGSDAACNTALTQYSYTTVQATYPCNMVIPFITSGACVLTSASSEIVQ